MSTPRGPLPRTMLPVSWLAARAYGFGAKLASLRADYREPQRLDLPVISIGNVTAGGTGKTPFTSRLASAVRAAGGHPAIALRGYRGEKTGGSDEAAEYNRVDPELPVIVGPDRAQQVRAYLANHDDVPDVLLLDDGFQHRQLHRDLDIVLVDATRSGLDGDLLPHGWLREPATALARADLVVLTHATGEDRVLDELVERYRGTPPEVSTRHAWDQIEVYEQGKAAPSGTDAKGKCSRVALASGIGNPVAFAAHVQSEGFEIAEELRFRDHAAYDDQAAARIAAAAARAGGLIVSGKDWVKLRELSPIVSLEVPVLVPRVTIEFLSGAETLAGRVHEVCGFAVSL